MLPQIPQTLTEIAIQKAETAQEVIKTNLPNGVTDNPTYDKAKEYWQTVDNWYKATKEERLEFTRKLDEVKKQAMEGEKAFLPMIETLKTWCTEYDNAIARKLEAENYSKQFEARLKAILQTLAMEHASSGITAKQVDLSKVMPVPYESHLKEVHITLATEWQRKATSIYLTYYKDDPKGEAAKEEAEMVKAKAQLEIASLESEKLDYKPKGARTEVKVELTSPTAVKAVFEGYLASVGSGILTDKNLSFLAKWAAKLPEERLAKLGAMEGVSVIKSIKTTKG